MHRLIDAIVIIAWISILTVSGSKLASILGGSLILSLLLGGGYFVSYVYREYQMEISLSGIVIMSLIFINYISYLEEMSKTQFVRVLLGFCLLALIVIVAFVYLGMRPLSSKPAKIEKRTFVDMKRRVYERLAFYPASTLGVFCIPTAFPFIDRGSSDFLGHGSIGYVPLATFWLALSFAATSIALRKIDRGISMLIPRDSERKSASKRKAFVLGLGVLLVFGSVMEIVRGAWALWVDTVLLLLLIFSSLWGIWRHVFYTEESIVTSPFEIGIPSLFRPKSILSIILAYAILGTVYLMCLTILLAS